MVVPRSAVKVAADDEFTLFSVTIFRKVKDEFAQKCREEKCALGVELGLNPQIHRSRVHL